MLRSSAPFCKTTLDVKRPSLVDGGVCLHCLVLHKTVYEEILLCGDY